MRYIIPKRRGRALLLGLVLAPAAIAANTGTQTAPETHPLGDIPDAQAFVRFLNSSGGYSLEVPEGWSRSGAGPAVTFTSKLNRLEVSVRPSASAPTAASVQATVLAPLRQGDSSLKVTLLRPVHLPAGAAILARFTSTGAVNDVTGRGTALENELYVVGRGTRQIVLRLSAPLGSDNVDAWTRMARSLVWK